MQVDFFTYLELVLGLGHVVEQKFQNERAAEASTLDFKVAKPGGSVRVLDVFDSDKTGIFHGVGEPVAPLCCG